MKKLELSQVRKELNLRIQTGVYVGNVAELCDESWGDEIDYDVFLPSINQNLQRPFCWTLEQKQQLILSIIKGIYIPKISVINIRHHTTKERAKGKIIQVIDGKQRISTVIDFYKNKFALLVDGNWYYYNDLSDQLKHTILFYDFIGDVVNEHHHEGHDEDNLKNKISDQKKLDWFEQINFTGTPQDSAHLENLKSAKLY